MNLGRAFRFIYAGLPRNEPYRVAVRIGFTRGKTHSKELIQHTRHSVLLTLISVKRKQRCGNQVGTFQVEANAYEEGTAAEVRKDMLARLPPGNS